MAAKIKKSLSGGKSRVYAVGPWYIQTNRASRQAFITSGDTWYPISRQEAANWLRNGRPD